MDNYRHPMYNRNNRNMGNYRKSSCGCGVTPVMDARGADHCDKEHHDMEHHNMEHHDCDHHECDHHECDHHFDKNLEDLSLAMAYVPWQRWRKVFDGAAGLTCGTIFQELVMPFYGDKNSCGMRGDRS